MFKRRGFTLIELLIVIALLGALAVGLLAALDPFEQLKKGTDTGTRNTVAEAQGAIIRFYSLRGNMPWCSAAAPTSCTDPSGKTLTQVNTGADYNTSPYQAINQVIATGELKTDFVTLAGTQMDKIYLTGTSGDTPSAIVCFTPNSKSFQSDVNTKYNSTTHDGTLAAAGSCKSQGGAVSCDWCVR